MDDTQYQLIAEQLGRMKDNLEARFKRVESMIDYSCTLEKERLDGIRAEIIEIKEITKDHEMRLRTATDNITALKTTVNTAQALQITLTLVASTIAAWLGTR